MDMTLNSDDSDAAPAHVKRESGNGKRKRDARATEGGRSGADDSEGESEKAANPCSKKRASASRSPPRSSLIESQETTSVKSESGRRLRRTEQTVYFSDVQAQEREISKIKSINKANADKEKVKETVALRKGAQAVVPPSPRSSKRARARSLRQARQRMSPCSPPDDPRLVGIRKGVPMVDLDDILDGAPRRFRFANNADAIKDAVLHSTAWRNKKLDVAPVNILADVPEITIPFAREFDGPLSNYDTHHVLAAKCAVVSGVTQSLPLSLTTGSSEEVRLPHCMVKLCGCALISRICWISTTTGYSSNHDGRTRAVSGGRSVTCDQSRPHSPSSNDHRQLAPASAFVSRTTSAASRERRGSRTLLPSTAGIAS